MGKCLFLRADNPRSVCIANVLGEMGAITTFANATEIVLGRTGEEIHCMGGVIIEIIALREDFPFVRPFSCAFLDRFIFDLLTFGSFQRIISMRLFAISIFLLSPIFMFVVILHTSIGFV